MHIVDSLAGRLISNIRSREFEKPIILTDKSVYISNENIWFRVFVLRSISKKFSSASKNLFVQLIDEKDSVISSMVLDATTGRLGGKLTLSQSLASGYYWLRAFTQSMAEDKINSVPLVPVYIINSPFSMGIEQETPFTNTYSDDDISVKFYPEGSSIITAANSVIAFYIGSKNRNNPQPRYVNGYVKDSRDSIVTRFTSDEQGLGKFTLYSVRSRKYTAHVTWHGKDLTFDLPSYNPYASQLAITKSADGQSKLRVLLEDSLNHKAFETYLLGIAKDSLCFISVGSGSYELALPQQKFPEGTATFYLLDNHLNILSERSVYFRNNNLFVKATLNDSIYKKREKASLSVSLKDARDQAVPASFSIAIVDTDFTFVESPSAMIAAYFEKQSLGNLDTWDFDNTENLSDEQLDILMIARACSYASLLKQNIPFTPHDNDSLLFIKGKAFYLNQKPAAKKVATLLPKSGNIGFIIDTTDTQGKFRFPLIEYPDSTQFLIQIANQHGKVEQVKVVLDSMAFPGIAGPPAEKQKFRLSMAMIKRYVRFYTDTSLPRWDKQLEPVIVRAVKKKELNYDEAKRISQFSKIITAEKFNKAGVNSVSNAVLEIPGLQLINGFVNIGGVAGFAPGPQTEPIIIENGVQVSLSSSGSTGSGSPVLTYLNAINPREISFIEVLTGPEGAAYGMRGGHGVILINTKQSFTPEKENTLLKSFVVRGYYNALLFKMPDYTNPVISSARFNDLRSTLYWNAISLTDPEGKIEIPFFTSDVPGVYKVRLRGVTIHGDIISKLLTFQIR